MIKELLSHTIESLEFRIDQVYDALRHAVATGQDGDAFWAWAVYQALDVNLRSNIFPKLMNERREIPRQTSLDRQLLQYAIIRTLPDYLRTAAMQPQQGNTKNKKREEIPVPDEELQALVTDPASSYMAIAARASQLTAAGQVEPIFMAVEHIRELYQKQA